MKTIEEIYHEMLELFRRETGAEASGISDLSVRFYAVAAQVYALYVQGEWLSRQCFPQTAEGEYLERHAALRGLERHGAICAEGSIRFSVDSPAAADMKIPAGTVCTTAGQIRFETLAEAVLKQGQTWVETEARAVEAGKAGNVPAGSILSMAVAPVGVSRCMNPKPFMGGEDPECDAALRDRVMETYRRMPNGANAAFYEQEALAFDGVEAAAVIPRARGKGTVDVIIATAAGMPDEALLEQVKSYFQTRREIAVDVEVKAPNEKKVDLSVRVNALDMTQREQTKAAVETALRQFFSGQRLSRGILLAELNQLMFSLPGVSNCAIKSPAADVAPVAGELPRLGTLTVEVV